MTEQEYMDATNLARIRDVNSILRNLHYLKENAELVKIKKKLYEIEDRLSNVVSTSETS